MFSVCDNEHPKLVFVHDIFISPTVARISCHYRPFMRLGSIVAANVLMQPVSVQLTRLTLHWVMRDRVTCFKDVPRGVYFRRDEFILIKLTGLTLHRFARRLVSCFRNAPPGVFFGQDELAVM